MVVSLIIALAVLSEQPEPVTVAPAPQANSAYVCKTIRHTGSQIKKSLVCLTKKEWARMSDENENFSRRMVDEARAGSIAF